MNPPPPAHTAPLPPARTTADGVRVLAGVPYAALPGARPLELDLYLPAHRAPVVLFLHGGGWRLGSRHSAGPQFAGSAPFEQLAQAGIGVASIDYRLSGEAVWPAQLHDAKAAVRWLRSRADELDVDPDRIAAWGESAGGHLAALLGLTGGELDGEVGVTGVPSSVRAVVAWYPPTELATVADPADPTSREAQLLGPRPRPTRSWPRRPARSPTPAPGRRRSCCCTGTPTGSSRTTRACGSRSCCPTSSSRPCPAPTTCGWAPPTPPRPRWPAPPPS